MLIVNDDQLRRASIVSLEERCYYCSKTLAAYPLILSDDADQTVYHATCAIQLATDIMVDLDTFFSPPAPYRQLYVLTACNVPYRSASLLGHCESQVRQAAKRMYNESGCQLRIGTARKEVVMFNVCLTCGEYCVEKTIDASGPFAICPYCGYAHPFLQLPLFLITGPSGAGKTTICLELVPLVRDCVILDSDILWGAVLATPENNYRDYRNLCLRIAKNVGQNGRPVVLGGTAIPEQFETCPERRYFSTLYYLALVCDDQLLEERLKQRPAWRHSGSAENIEDMLRFNRWLKDQASITHPPLTLFDTSHRSVFETVRDVAQWIRQHL